MQGHLRAAGETELPGDKSDAAIGVERQVANDVLPAWIFARPRRIPHAAAERGANLPAVRMTRQLQQHAWIIGDNVGVVWLVYQGDDRGIRGDASHGGGEIVFAAPNIVDAREVQCLPIALDGIMLIAQYGRASLPQGLGDSAFASPPIVIAEDCEYTVRHPQA